MRKVSRVTSQIERDKKDKFNALWRAKYAEGLQQDRLPDIITTPDKMNGPITIGVISTNNYMEKINKP